MKNGCLLLLVCSAWMVRATGTGIPGANPTGEEVTKPQRNTPLPTPENASERPSVRVDVNVQPPEDSFNKTNGVNHTSTVSSSIDAANAPQSSVTNTEFEAPLALTPLLDYTTLVFTPPADRSTYGRQITTAPPQTVKEILGTSSAAPDMTPTSQSIFVRTGTSSRTERSSTASVVTVSSTQTSTNASNLWSSAYNITDHSETSSNSPQSSGTLETTLWTSDNETVLNYTESTFPNNDTEIYNTTAIPDKISLILTFNSSCDDGSSIENQLQDQIGLEPSQIQSSSCQSLITVDVGVQNSSETSRLKDLIGKAQLTVQGINFTLVNVRQVSQSCPGETDSGFVPNMFSGIFLSSREIVTYAIVGAIFGIAILLVIALLCCKCWCRRRRKTMDDIPHLTMRLEDYSLTRIPRPSTIYSDGRTAGYTNGIDRHSQAFDTSVIPIEEAPTIYGLRRDLQSFNGKRLRPRHHEPEEDLYARGGSVLAGSTERLNRGSVSSRRGAENPTFRF